MYRKVGSQKMIDGPIPKKVIAEEIRALANLFANELRSKIDGRVAEMEEDATSHYLIYQVLGIANEEGRLIDVYQNKGRFLYKYAGTFLERAAKLCFLERFPDSASLRISNTVSQRPKTFEIDCLVDHKDAFEIKWRDATTDGDHITKEHSRLQAIASAGYKPIRIMFTTQTGLRLYASSRHLRLSTMASKVSITMGIKLGSLYRAIPVLI